MKCTLKTCTGKGKKRGGRRKERRKEGEGRKGKKERKGVMDFMFK